MPQERTWHWTTAVWARSQQAFMETTLPLLFRSTPKSQINMVRHLTTSQSPADRTHSPCSSPAGDSIRFLHSGQWGSVCPLCYSWAKHPSVSRSFILPKRSPASSPKPCPKSTKHNTKSVNSLCTTNVMCAVPTKQLCPCKCVGQCTPCNNFHYIHHKWWRCTSGSTTCKPQPHPVRHLARQLSCCHQRPSKHERECVPMVHKGGGGSASKYITSAFVGVSRMGRNQCGYLSPAFLGSLGRGNLG